MPARQAAVETVTIRPNPGPQERFLSSQATIVIFGGARGGGKTWSLLLEAWRHYRVPHFRAVLFRRTTPQITNAGGPWDESMKLYPQLGARPREGHLEWTWPSGARVEFSHLEHESDAFNWQGAQMALLEFDELPHFTEKQFFFMLMNVRSTTGIRPYVRATCNPDPDSWVARLIEWWIDQETGYPIPERSGVPRYFVRSGDELIWADTAEELKAGYPHLFEPVLLSDGTYSDPVEPKSLTFIPSKVEDNLQLMKADPGYRMMLLSMPEVDRERFYGGNWKIRPAAGKVFDREWFEIVDWVPSGGVEVARWDFAATQKEIRGSSPTARRGNDPDSTARARMVKVGGIYYITDVLDVQYGPARTDEMFFRTTREDRQYAAMRGARFKVRWEIEPGSSGVKEDFRLRKALPGYDRLGVRARGDKLLRWTPLAIEARAGMVKLLRGPWNERFLSQLHMLPDGAHDDMADAAAGAFADLNDGKRAGGAAGGERPRYDRQRRGGMRDGTVLDDRPLVPTALPAAPGGLRPNVGRRVAY